MSHHTRPEIVRHLLSKCVPGTIAILLLAGSVTRAADYYWTNPVSGQGNDPAKWTPNGIPGIGDTAIFDLGSAGYTVTIPGLSNLEVNNDTIALSFYSNVSNNVLIGVDKDTQGTVSVAISILTIYPPSDQASALVVGVAGTGTLSVNNYGTVNVGGDFVVAQDSGSKGTVTVDGSRAELVTPGFGNANMRSITIGAGGDGSFTVKNGGTSYLAGPFIIGQFAGSNGSVTVDGMGSFLGPPGYGSQEIESTIVGESGKGSISVTNGATASLGYGKTIVGSDAGVTGSVLVDGVGSGIAFGNSLILGENGTGSLTISNGATAGVGNDVVLADNADAKGTILVDHATLNSNTNSFTVARDGVGELSLVNGSTLNSQGTFIIGQNTDSNGTVSVSGAGSSFSGGKLTVADAGIGSFSATNGTNIKIAGSIVIANSAHSKGDMTLDHAALDGTSYAYLNSVIVGAGGTGSLSLTNGTTANVQGEFIIGQIAGSEGTVTLDGAGTSFGSNWLNSTVVGASGNGSLSLSDGATANVQGQFIIGQNEGSKGTATIDGACTTLGGNWLNSILVGQNGNGSLSVSNGAVVTAYSIQVGPFQGSGSLDVEGGAVVHARDVRNGIHGTISIGSDSLIVGPVMNAGSLHIDGAISGNVFQNSGSLSGTGAILGNLNLQGGTVAPGDSPGTLTVSSFHAYNSTFDFEINSANGTAGNAVGWNLLSSLGGVSFVGTLTIDLESLDQNNHAGQLIDFDPTRDYHWTFLTGSSISGFDSSIFNIDTSGFINPIEGHFSVSEVGNSLVLNYTAVPEVGTIVLAAIGLGIVLLAGRFRRLA